MQFFCGPVNCLSYIFPTFLAESKQKTSSSPLNFMKKNYNDAMYLL